MGSETGQCPHGFYLLNCDCGACNPDDLQGYLPGEKGPQESLLYQRKPTYVKFAPLMGPLCNIDDKTTLEQTMEFVTKDSGDKKEFTSGMVRNSTAGKLEWHRVTDGPMLRRWAGLLTRGGTIYPDVKPGQANWTLADGEAELERFRQSALRHFLQWWYGDQSEEDHAAAIYFNVNGAEFVKAKLESK